MLNRYQTIRQQTTSLAEGLSAEDLSAQSMPDASPGKWHFAHTTWFFETFLLKALRDGSLAGRSKKYQEFHPQFNFLFNSYYDNVGSRHARPQRGLLTRPSLDEVIQYREHVDASMLALLDDGAFVHRSDIENIVVIGLHHEMQHQELFLTDLLHLFSRNPLLPSAFSEDEKTRKLLPEISKKTVANKFIAFDGGLTSCGQSAIQECQWSNFSYDCEQPKHKVFLNDYALSPRLINNAEWLAFIQDGGYQNSLLWLSDGWAACQKNAWQAPLYWQHIDGQWFQFGLDGLKEVDPMAPVCHISYYEAEAFARWAGKRLPTEFEWEAAALKQTINGNFLERKLWRPKASTEPLGDLFGNVWEWTQSPFSPYPQFASNQGALGEYNGKFMANQFVLKGGSCVTPQAQIRASYRNFFYPHHRWQFTGLRLADDV